MTNPEGGYSSPIHLVQIIGIDISFSPNQPLVGSNRQQTVGRINQVADRGDGVAADLGAAADPGAAAEPGATAEPGTTAGLGAEELKAAGPGA